MNDRIINLVREFHISCDTKLKTDASFSIRFQNAISDDEYNSIASGNMEIVLSNADAFFGFAIDRQNRDAKTLEMAEIYAAIVMRSCADEEIIDLLPHGLRDSQVSRALNASGARNLSLLALR